MRVLNLSAKFKVGATVVAKDNYVNGSMFLSKGTVGSVYKVTIESFPDLGLFDLRIIHFSFGSNDISMGEDIAKGYFEIV